MSYTIRKDDQWWRIERDGQLVDSARSKKLASITIKLFDGDLSVAPQWYRMVIADAAKRMSQRDAVRTGVFKAQQIGLGPAQVHALPDGTPIDALTPSSP